MTAERLLQICIASMAALATLMLGTSQDSVMLPISAFAAALLSVCFTDVLGWFHLNRFVAGTAGVVAAMNAFMQSQGTGLEGQFISVANLLIHLQIILLFQKKNERIYWQLITLSLLQVVVAAALNLFFLFGALLVVYTAIAIGAMLLFFIYRETAPFIDDVSVHSRHAVAQIESLGTAVAEGQKHGRRRPRMELFRVSFARYFGVLSISTIVVAAGVFLLMPRYGDGVWRAKSTVAKTGLSDSVNLEDSGSIYESPTLVMRVSFTSEATGEPYIVNMEPYFRGAVLQIYRGNGRWVRGDRELSADEMPPLPRAERITSVVRQTMSFERPRGDDVVCSVPPARGLDITPKTMGFDRSTHEIRYELAPNDDPTQYALGTLGLRNGMQSQYSPSFETSARRAPTSRPLPGLAALAQSIVQDLPEDDVVGRARALEAHFTGGGRYKYSLDPSPDRNPAIDPVVDFALNHKSGHCQHYASALTLMLNLVDIPARVVVGYRGGVYNLVGNYYQLREMDAHAWVEALIPADRVPRDEVMPTEGLDGDAWMRLDPTPSGDINASSMALSPWRQKVNDTVDYMQLLWSEYVLGLNEKRQQKAIYEPIKAAFQNLGTLMFSRQAWAARWEQVGRRLRGDFFTQANARDSVIAIAVLTIAFYVARFLLRSLWQYGRRWLDRRALTRRPRVEFYRRFETLLAKQGVRRAPQQTHRQFAVAASECIAGATHDPALAEIPAQVVDLFYRVRFGHHRLDNLDRERLENWLASLQESLTPKRK